MKQEIFRNIWGVPEIFDLTYFYEKDEDLIEMYYSNTSQGGEEGYLFLTHCKSLLPKFYTVVDLDKYFNDDNLYVVYDYIIDRFLRESSED